ncbi:MAG: 30S ribosomal protein S6, partial [Chloroflexi bacterium]|nr:30S ribosomal protein S6 [Chloroflexota bacterium]
MRHYELVTILSPILNQEQSIEAWDRIKEFITNREAEIVREQNWGTRRLAYPIHKGAHHFLEGTYYLTHFRTERPFNQELETFLRLDERVLRSLVIATGPPPPEPEPAPVVEPVAEAEEAADESPQDGLERNGAETAVAVAEAVAEEAPVAEAEAV